MKEKLAELRTLIPRGVTKLNLGLEKATFQMQKLRGDRKSMVIVLIFTNFINILSYPFYVRVFEF